MSGSTPTPREPIAADAEELACVGVRYVSDDLFVGVAGTGQHQLHFGLERLTRVNAAVWRHYRASAASVSDLLGRLARRMSAPREQLDLDALAGEYGWSHHELQHVAEVMGQGEHARKKIFRSVKGGVTGFEWLLDEEFAPTEDRFVAYVARRPLELGPCPAPFDRTEPDASQLRQHQSRYADLLMTVGVATEHGLPTVTHFGIFRNPTAFLDPERGHRRLAMRLHGFAATVSLCALSGKHYVITNPMPEMINILRRTLARGDVYVAEDDADARSYLSRNLPTGSPRLDQQRRISFAGFTLDARPTLVKLEAMASHYQPIEQPERTL